MCKWEDITFSYGQGKIRISANTIADACQIIREMANKKQLISYTDVMNQLKARKHRKINRGTIGTILGEVSSQIAQNTHPSIYPSSIVIRKGTIRLGDGFWKLNVGTNPPANISRDHRRYKLQQYQQDVFNKNWNCKC